MAPMRLSRSSSSCVEGVVNNRGERSMVRVMRDSSCGEETILGPWVAWMERFATRRVS